MSTVDQSPTQDLAWYDRVSDWFNAILIRESRQSLKSRQFIATFMLLLAIAWVVSVFGLLNSGSALEFGSVGRDFFYYFFCALAFAALVLVPFSAFRSLQVERELNTFDLLSITSLKPRQIVWGKLLSTGLQLFLFYSAITPFMAFASLLQGFNTGTALVLLMGLLLYSLFLSMAALMLSSFGKHRVLQGMFAAVTLMGLVSNYFWTISGTWIALRMDLILVATTDFWWIAGIAVVAVIAEFTLCQQIAISQLTFESDNHSTGVRLICSVQFWLVWIVMAIYCFVRETAPSAMILSIVAGLSALLWAVAGLVFCTEGDFLSRRVQREVPKNKLWRLVKSPFLPGGARGYLLALLHLAALWWIIVLCQSFEAMRPAGMSLGEYYASLVDLQSEVWTMPLRVATIACAYAAAVLGIATALSRWGQAVSAEVKPAHVRVIIILLFTAGVIFPLVLRAADVVKDRGYAIVDLTSPPATIAYVVRHRTTQQVEFEWSSFPDSVQRLVAQRGFIEIIIVSLGSVALLLMLLNSLALVRSVWGLKPLDRR